MSPSCTGGMGTFEGRTATTASPTDATVSGTASIGVAVDALAVETAFSTVGLDACVLGVTASTCGDGCGGTGEGDEAVANT